MAEEKPEPYYFEGRDIYKRAHVEQSPAGEILVNAGFHVCKITYGVDSPELICAMLNLAQRVADHEAAKQNHPRPTITEKP